MRVLYAFLGGALIGATAAVLLTPESGKDLRLQIKNVLLKYGLIKEAEEDAILEQIVSEIETANAKAAK